MPILDQFGRPYQAVSTAYRGGDVTRLNKDWQPEHRSGDTAIEESWDLMTSRVRDLFRNDPVMKSCKRGISKGVIGGYGIQSFAEAEDDDDQSLDDFNEEADEWFDQWATQDIDAEGELGWAQMQWLAFSEMMETGENLFLECWDDSPGRVIPLCYQLIEAEQIDETRNWDENKSGSRRRCRRGVELDSRNRKVAIWLYNDHPHELQGGSLEASRIPMSRILHVYMKARPTEHRGATWFSANMQTSRDIDWYLGNELTAAALGALLTAYIKRKQGGGNGTGFMGTGYSEDTSGNAKFKLARGTVAELGPDDEVGMIESNRPNRDADPFIKLLLMMQGMGIGLSPLRVTGDYRQASYTSARGAHLDDEAYFVVLQQWFARLCVKPIRQRFTRIAAAQGLFRSVSPLEFQRHQRRYEKIEIQPPGREQLDPESETGAAMDRIRAGLSTHQIECGKRGYHWRKLAKQQARERKFFQSLNLEPDVNHSAAFLARRQGRTGTTKSPATTEAEYA